MSNEDWEDPFDQEAVPSLSFKDAPIGKEFRFKVLKRAEMVQSRDYDTGDPAFWPDGNKKMSAVLKIEVLAERLTKNGKPGPWRDSEQEGERAIWAAKPSSMFTALATAQRDAGAKFEPGGVGTVKFTAEEEHKDKKKNAIKQYSATYAPEDPFETGGAAEDNDEPPF